MRISVLDLEIFVQNLAITRQNFPRNEYQSQNSDIYRHIFRELRDTALRSSPEVLRGQVETLHHFQFLLVALRVRLPHRKVQNLEAPLHELLQRLGMALLLEKYALIKWNYFYQIRILEKSLHIRQLFQNLRVLLLLLQYLIENPLLVLKLILVLFQQLLDSPVILALFTLRRQIHHLSQATQNLLRKPLLLLDAPDEVVRNLSVQVLPREELPIQLQILHLPHEHYENFNSLQLRRLESQVVLSAQNPPQAIQQVPLAERETSVPQLEGLLGLAETDNSALLLTRINLSLNSLHSKLEIIRQMVLVHEEQMKLLVILEFRQRRPDLPPELLLNQTLGVVIWFFLYLGGDQVVLHTSEVYPQALSQPLEIAAVR